MPFTHGQLRRPDAAPDTGESTQRLAALGGVVVDHILSGHLAGPVDYEPDTDEWVVVLHGRATLEVGDTPMHLGPGDWVLLPARVPHRLTETQPGTSWLTVTASSPPTGAPLTVPLP